METGPLERQRCRFSRFLNFLRGMETANSLGAKELPCQLPKLP